MCQISMWFICCITTLQLWCRKLTLYYVYDYREISFSARHVIGKHKLYAHFRGFTHMRMHVKSGLLPFPDVLLAFHAIDFRNTLKMSG